MTGFLLLVLCAGASGREPPPEVGETVPSFTATALDGSVVSLRDALATHRAVVVLFLSTVCPYANLFGKHVGRLADVYGPRGVLFVGVNSNQYETAEEMNEAAESHDQRFPLIRDADASIANRLGASCSPEAYVIDAGGRLRYHGWVQSKQRAPDLERALRALLDGRPVRPARTKAFGCTLDRPGPSFDLENHAGPDLP